MRKEAEYIQSVSREHRKQYGQYFTDLSIVRFMASWACQNAKTVLDPAAGDGRFLRAAKEVRENILCAGYELDPEIYNFFDSNPDEIHLADYLSSGWEKYDAILCNPPYQRFQKIPNRQDILERIYNHTGIRYSGYASLAVLFLIKSLYQLNDGGCLAYILPADFLNTDYGIQLKELLVQKRILHSVYLFENDAGLFSGATTSCCIVFAENKPHESVQFYKLASLADLETENLPFSQTEYTNLDPGAKWRSYFNTGSADQADLFARSGIPIRPLSDYAKVRRGIATGANSFFCLNQTEAENLGLNQENQYLSPCICYSRDVSSCIFTAESLERLRKDRKKIWLLDLPEDITDAQTGINPALKAYLESGRADKLPERYLLSKRVCWYIQENVQPADLWISANCREKIRIIQNEAGVKNLTTFHGMYLKEEYRSDADLLFAWLLSDMGQNLLKENKRQMGGGLEKYQPKDLMKASVLDLDLVPESARFKLFNILDTMRMQEKAGSLSPKQERAGIEKLNRIFESILTAGNETDKFTKYK